MSKKRDRLVSFHNMTEEEWAKVLGVLEENGVYPMLETLGPGIMEAKTWSMDPDDPFNVTIICGNCGNASFEHHYLAKAYDDYSETEKDGPKSFTIYHDSDEYIDGGYCWERMRCENCGMQASFLELREKGYTISVDG